MQLQKLVIVCHRAFYYKFFQVKHITGTTADIFLEYIQRNLPAGVDMSVYQVCVTLVSCRVDIVIHVHLM